MMYIYKQLAELIVCLTIIFKINVPTKKKAKNTHFNR